VKWTVQTHLVILRGLENVKYLAPLIPVGEVCHSIQDFSSRAEPSGRTSNYGAHIPRCFCLINPESIVGEK